MKLGRTKLSHLAAGTLLQLLLIHNISHFCNCSFWNILFEKVPQLENLKAETA